MSKRILLLLILLSFTLVQASSADQVGLYFERADWEAAMSLHGTNPLTSIGFDRERWTSSLILYPNSTDAVSQSDQGITVTSGYSAPGYADNSTLGHVANGIWVDNISKYGSTSFAFANSIFGFGGDFNITGANGLYLSPIGDVGGGTSGYQGFIGIISDQPMNSFLISWGESGGCYACFGNSYSLSGLEVATLPIPEPDFRYAFTGLFIAVVGYKSLQVLLRR